MGPSPYQIDDPSELLSPSLVIFRDLVQKNLEMMIAMAGSASRLRPHAKTHKMPAVTAMETALGITKHKCATIAEAEMIARAGGSDVLIAYPIVGPNLKRLAKLVERFPEVKFRVILDDIDVAEALSQGMNPPLSVLIDVDVGMGRTGIALAEVANFYRHCEQLPGLSVVGLHAYDGHIRESDPIVRKVAAQPGIDSVLELRRSLISEGFDVPLLVLGGTPTFPIHAKVTGLGIECSPGTCVFHDASYADRFPDLPFTPAALLLTRVISRPRPGRLCLDVGHKAVAADPAGARLRLLGVPEAAIGPQSEEHLVVETPHSRDFPPGTPLLAIPTHVCPTCALHQKAYVMEGGKLVDEWEVQARNRVLTV